MLGLEKMERLMDSWTQVVTNPLGLAAFSLFLVYWYLSRRKSSPKWLISACLAMAFIVSIGALALGYRHITKEPVSQNPASSQDSMRIGKIDQKTDGGPAVSGVQGSVSISQEATPDDSQEKPAPSNPDP